jgi:hypothetical protein
MILEIVFAGVFYWIVRRIMAVALALKRIPNAIKQIGGVAGVLLCCAMPVQAQVPKTFAPYDPPSDLVLTLPDPLLAEAKASASSDQVQVTNDQNILQTSLPKSKPVNVNCDVDVIQNTLNNVPISSRVFGECGLHYHY